jgi:hypothetical protein
VYAARVFGFFVSSVSSRNLANAAATDGCSFPASGRTDTPLLRALSSASLRWRRAAASCGSLPTEGHPPALFTPFEVVGAFGMGFRPAVYEDQVWLPPPIWRQNNGAIAETLAGLDPFDEVYFLTACWTPVTPPIQRGISIGITSLQVPDNKSNGGEGGIRSRLIQNALFLPTKL